MYSVCKIIKRILTYLDISAQTLKNPIGIQKQTVNKIKTVINLKAHPPSWMTAAQLFLGKIRRIMSRWKQKSVKVILKTADVPKQAVAAP